ncbi:FimV/HubP family polar landmark protein, partial [Piscirickettsia litoralis]|uniref:FimV/HubP family polar landmark protein n=1 Tax=Piscirickettsia litoralis TaxID=1891921 RepID=UPI0029390D83
EAETPEAETPEAETPEAETPEVETPEAETPEAETPEAETPEAETPEADLELVEEDAQEGEVAEGEEGAVNLNVSVRGGGDNQDVQTVSLDEGDEATLTMGEEESEAALDDIRLEEESDDSNVGADVDILAGDNEVSAQLDAARAYVLAEDVDSARRVLRDVLKQGDSGQQDEARQLLAELDGAEEAST